MSVYTPRGIKIRFDIPVLFALIARVSEKAGPSKVLSATEAIDIFVNIVCTIAVIASMYADTTYKESWFFIAASFMFAHAFKATVFRVFPVFIDLCQFLVPFIGWGLHHALMIFAVIYWGDWHSFVAYYVVVIVGDMVAPVFTQEIGGSRYSSAERSFILAFRHYARRAKADISLDLDATELEQESWGPTFQRYCEENPDAAQMTVSQSA